MSDAAPTELAGRRILVTGGAGLIGSTIIDQLLDHEPREVVVLDNLERGRAEHLAPAQARGNVRLVVGEVTDVPTVRDAVDGIDVVFHQAAIRITQCAEEPRRAVDVLGMGAFNVFEAAAESGVRKVVAASSASVYGQADVLPTSEDHHPWDNDTIYGALKVFNEGMLRAFHQTHGLDYVALRYFNVYGPRMDTMGVYTEVLVRWMERLEAGEPPLILGDGLQTMDFVHVADVARANVAAATSGVTDEAFNVGTGRETSLKELAQALSEVMDRDLAPTFGPPRATNGVRHRKADVSAAARRLGFTAQVPLEEGLADLVSWWRAQRALVGEAS